MTVSNKKALFQQRATAAARKTSLRAKDIVVTLNERERLGSTGFGGGTAIPHGTSEGLDRMFGYFARLRAPLEFQEVDNLPVALVFLLLSPPDAVADPLKALAGVTRALRDRAPAATQRGGRSRATRFGRRL